MRADGPLGGGQVVQRIIKRIEQALITGELKAGDKLPTEKEFVEKFKVSRTSFREAIKMLIALGVVEIKRGDGTYISKADSESIVNPLIFPLVIQEKTSRDLLELRKILEMGIVELMVEKADQDDLMIVEETIKNLEQASQKKNPDNQELLQYDLAFHHACAKATHNPLITKLMRTILDLLAPYIEHSHKRLGGVKLALKEHKAILDAIKERNFQKAKERINRSLKSWKKYGLEDES